MARGITETDVHTAADEIVRAGERPTVERIRVRLGTGSPNTVTRWLETWWQGMGRRLDGHAAQLAVPDAPEAVARAAGQWWALALEAAKASLEEEVSAERAALRCDRDALLQEREALDAEAAILRSDNEAALAAKRLAEAQATELSRLVTRLEAQIEELTGQRDAAGKRESEIEASRQALEQRYQALQETAAAEREGFLQYSRTAEDRANTEIDRARQEAKALQATLSTMKKERAADQESQRRVVEAIRNDATTATREKDIQRARADALEEQLAKLRDFPAAIEAALRRTGAPTGTRKKTEKTASRKPAKRARVAMDKS
ncbi:DNA-binding protein [Marilutibacter spongiae]|uniref:DNA-binding protein n=1 Tax=Marilutibacter spongiae TaxID=2025720 RepID=A0A7W3Y7L0_9GAMM|nr:DNA-binding protein [Lysobacter spongiae]MBB1062071.1 DNA-binding protein [Lysobacter spongiae]